MNDIVLIGGGGHCKSVIDVIEQEGIFSIVGILDKSEHLGSNVTGYPVIGNDSNMAIKFGIGRATYDSAQEIRNNDITRAEGVALIKRFDGEFPKQYIEDCCKYMDITLQQYHDAIEKFRSPHLWHKINGAWKLKKPIWEEGDFK